MQIAELTERETAFNDWLSEWADNGYESVPYLIVLEAEDQRWYLTMEPTGEKALHTDFEALIKEYEFQGETFASFEEGK